ncbi:hypothetical protein [Pseudoduganella sp. HUAS MS19]
MTHIKDRRSAFNQAMTVEKGIWMASHEGIGTAIEYLHEHGVADGVA